MSPDAQLDAEAASLQSLLTVLQREQACLVDGDVEAHAGLLEAKAGCVADLSRLADERHRSLKQLGFQASEIGMQHWLAQSQEPVRKVWTALLDLVRDAHEANRVNGLLLGQRQSRNRQALTALGLGASSGLYGASGQAELAVHAARPARVTG